MRQVETEIEVEVEVEEISGSAAGSLVRQRANVQSFQMPASSSQES